MDVLLTNIDDVRAEIMRLEDADVFDQAAWSRVLAQLNSEGRVAGYADAWRRMCSARSRQASAEDADFLAPVSMETVF